MSSSSNVQKMARRNLLAVFFVLWLAQTEFINQFLAVRFLDKATVVDDTHWICLIIAVVVRAGANE